MVHPVAGKCKHCKADLTAHRATRPAASAPLPPLHQAHGGKGPPTGASHATAHGPIAVAAPEVQPVLPPPRPTARGRTAEPGGATWRSWPVLVIVLAMGAIIVAVVLMVWPVGAREPGKRTLQPPPAPERMLTDPDVKPPPPRAQPGGAPDPWSSQNAPAPAVPAPAPSPPDTDADDQDVDALKDPFAPAAPSAARPRLRLNPRGALVGHMLVRMCRKLIACRIDDPLAGKMCDQIVQPQPPSPSPTTCPAAQRCLQHIDDMSCDHQSTSLNSIGALMTQVEDCAEAASC